MVTGYVEPLPLVLDMGHVPFSNREKDGKRRTHGQHLAHRVLSGISRSFQIAFMVVSAAFQGHEQHTAFSPNISEHVLPEIMPQHHVDAMMTEGKRYLIRRIPIIVIRFEASCGWWQCMPRRVNKVESLRVLPAVGVNIEVTGNAWKHTIGVGEGCSRRPHMLLMPW